MRSKAIFMALLALSFTAQARPVLTSEAARAARTWIASGKVLGARLGASVDPAKVRTVVVDRGVSFHLVPIEGGGTVVTSSDTEFEPIVLFTDKSVGELDRKGPLYRLLAKDAYARARLAQIRAQLTARVAAAQPGTLATSVSSAAANLSAAAARASRQWDILAASAPTSAAQPITNDPPNRVISDLRVPALLKTKWDQSDVDGEPFYNYWINERVSSNKLCGCTATAMSQIIRYFEYPENGTSKEYKCVVDGSEATFKTFGGTMGEGGEVVSGYDYANMPYVPSADDPDFRTQQIAVGSLTYDCAVALGSSFGDGLTSAYGRDTAKVMRDQFGYRSAFVFADQGVIRGTSVGLHSETLREKTIYANLDAGKPVQMGIYGYVKSIVGDETILDESNVEGHSVVADGYGFTAVRDGARTAYVHVNLGWSGQDDAWYNIPEIDTATVGAMQGWSTGVDFLYLGEATFNVVSNNVDEVGKEIVAGRVLNADGTSYEGADVQVLNMKSEVVARTTSNSNGIYVAYVSGGADYEIWASSATGDLIAASERIHVERTTGDSSGIIEDPAKVGNRWGYDLKLEPPAARLDGAARRVYPTLDKAFAAINRDGAKLVEILRPIELRGDLVITNGNLTICATNADPRASEIVRLNGAKITVMSGVTVTFSNIAFRTEMSTPVEVLKGGLVKVAGVAVFDDIVSGVPGIVTENNTGFKLIGELLNGLTLRCGSVTTGDRRCGSYYLPSQEIADRSALHVISPEGRDRACVAVEGDLLWEDDREVLEGTAVAYVAGGAEPVYYRTLDRLFEEHPAGTNVIVTRSNVRLGNPCAFTAACSIFPADGLGAVAIRVANMDKRPAFTLDADAKLTVGNLLFADYEGAGLFSVNGAGAALTVSNVTFRNVHGKQAYAGAIALETGSAHVVNSTFENCRTDGGKGGAIYAGAGCGLDLEGDRITGCWANTRGGGIYAMGGSTIRVSGALRVCGNTYGRYAKGDDIYLVDSTARFELVGRVDGFESIGVTYGQTPGNNFGNAEGNRLSVIACDASDATNSAVAFRNDVNPGLVAQVSDDGAHLVWAQPAIDDYQLPWGTKEEREALTNRAVACVVKGSERAYYEDVGYAFGWIDAPARVVLLKDAALSTAVEISRAVTFRSGALALDGDELVLTESGLTNVLTRTANVRISVAKDASLTVERVTLDGGNGTCGLVDVSGGTLVLDAGATVRNVSGSEDRASGGVTVTDGTFVMNDGAAIVDCSNSYRNEGSKAGYGGGLLAERSTVRLNGGRIEGCSAHSAGGAFIGNGSTVYVSGDVVITGNTSRKGDDNLCVSDDSQLFLTGTPFSGAIGYMPGASADPDVFGRVDGGFEGTVSNALDSAHCFTNDVTRDVGMVAENAGERLLVWSTAFSADGTFVARNGKKYGLVAGSKVRIAVPTKVSDPIRYTGNVQTGVVEGVGYVLGGNTGVLPNAYHATATLRPGFVWDDGTTGPKTVDWEIGLGVYELTGVMLKDAEFPYDGEKHVLEITGELPDGLAVTYLGNVMTLPGTNDVTATVFGEIQYYEPFTTNYFAKLIITGTYDPQGDDPGPVPPIDKPSPFTVKTNAPTPIAFSAIMRLSDSEWRLVVTDLVEQADYAVSYTSDLTMPFTTDTWVRATSSGAWTNDVSGLEAKPAYFWRAHGRTTYVTNWLNAVQPQP